MGARKGLANLRAMGAARDGGCRWGSADGKVIIERLCISLPYVDTFKSKVIKGFVPELRSRKCFSCFGIPMFLCYEHSMYVSHIRIMGMVHELFFLAQS